MDLHDLPPPLLQVRQLCKSYPAPRRHWLALPAQQRVLNNVDFELHAGRCLGLVGASGSGKSTLARLILALESPTSGQVLLDGQDLHRLPAAALRPLRQHMAMVFQDPATALNPRRSVGCGQRQRIAIARAIITRPRLLVLDEPVSALDVSVQAQVLNVLLQLQQELGLAYLLISHDLAVISHLCHHMLVLHAGEVVESGSPQQLQRAAHDPITQALLRSVPTITPGAARQRYAAHHNQ